MLLTLLSSIFVFSSFVKDVVPLPWFGGWFLVIFLDLRNPREKHIWTPCVLVGVVGNAERRWSE